MLIFAAEDAKQVGAEASSNMDPGLDIEVRTNVSEARTKVVPRDNINVVWTWIQRCRWC